MRSTAEKSQVIWNRVYRMHTLLSVFGRCVVCYSISVVQSRLRCMHRRRLLDSSTCSFPDLTNQEASLPDALSVVSGVVVFISVSRIEW